MQTSNRFATSISDMSSLYWCSAYSCMPGSVANDLLSKIKSITKDFDKTKVGIEATGHYSYNLLGFLLDNGLPTYVLNPLHTNLYRKSLSLRKTKTDKVDARTIASTQTCGLHIHMNRAFLGKDEIEQDLNIAKLIILFEMFRDSYIVPFSRRNIANMDRWASKPTLDYKSTDTENEIFDKAIS